jgi:hypothetical protein
VEEYTEYSNGEGNGLPMKLFPSAFIFFIFLISSCSAVNGNNNTIVNKPLPVRLNPTHIINPTYTPASTYTPNPTYTPYLIVITPTFTETSIPTSTIIPSATPVPGIGASVMCGSSFSIKVLEKPQFETIVYSSKSEVGKFLILRVEITNLTSANYQAQNENDFTVSANIGGNRTIFNYDPWSSIEMNSHTYGLYKDVETSPFPPGVKVKAIIIFDTNPKGEEWKLVFTPRIDILSNPVCELEIPLDK